MEEISGWVLWAHGVSGSKGKGVRANGTGTVAVRPWGLARNGSELYLSLQAMRLQRDKLSVPKPEHLCSASLHPRKLSQQLIEGSPRASPPCPL